ncbi:MAG TPA: DUF2092 domain-containing protein [Ktedonobacterales bacterium]
MRMLLRSRMLTITLLALSAMLALGGCAMPGLPSSTATNLSASEIALRATQVQFKDIAFTLSINAGSLIPIQGTGTGLVTKGPDRSQVTVDVPISLGDKPQDTKVEAIADLATSKVYTRTTTNANTSQWEVQSVADASSDFASLIDARDMSSPILAGTETVNGVQCYHLTGTYKDSPVEAWINTSSFHLVKAIGSAKSDGITVNVTLNVTGYDTGKTITLPAV